ncbi:MAG: ABC transporter permease [Chloroflexota bacterium]|nr:ABC transporter permease [Chloroflexota bacterium]
MNWQSIRAIIIKDLSLFSRNQFFAVITLLGLGAYIAIYFVMPSTVDESVDIGIYAPVVPSSLQQLQESGQGLDLVSAESEEELRQGVAENDYIAGVVLPADIEEKFESQEPAEIKLYFTSDTPEDTIEFIDFLITEVAYLETGQYLAVEWQQEILGPDMVGTQIPPRDKLRSLFAVLIMVTETFALASLIGEEIEKRTGQALLVTPMTVRDLFTAKAIVGVMLAFSQALLFVLVVGGLSEQPLIILTALILGAVLVTGVGFLMASLGKDFLTTMVWGVPVLIIFSIPAIGIMMPGAVSDWIKIIPSYYVTDTMYQASIFGSGWGSVGDNLLILVAFNVVFLSAGILTLRRRFQ